MARSQLVNYFYGMSIALLFLISGMVVLQSDETVVDAGVPTRADGPVVNKSQVTITLYEGFSEFSGQHFFGTGKGSLDLFYDPNYDWKEGDIQYPHKAFEVSYPWGYDKSNTPIEVKFVTSHYDTNFAMATVTCQDDDFNSYIYGQNHFKVTVTGWNASGSATAEIWFEILNVNDPPTVISEKDFFSIKMDEDGFFDGINKDNDQPDDIFGDLSDPDDELTFTVVPFNDLASPDNIVVDLESDGSSIIFTPVKDFACPYVPTNNRLSASNPHFALFQFNISDQDGEWVKVDGGKLPILRVYVGPVNDAPVMELPDNYYFNEGELVTIQFEASDVDPETEQELVYGTNLSTIIREKTNIQLEFEEGYDFDSRDGTIQFNTNNKMVGVYPVAAWVDDRPSKDMGTKADYPTTPYKVYSNFTLNIVNRNDPPNARMDSPSDSFVYSTSVPVEFNATRTTDPDLIHGQELTYKWTANGESIGEGMVVYHLFETEGLYNIKLNVTDGEFFSVVTKTITVEKTRILGEPFEGKDIELDYNDNASDALVLYRSQTDMYIQFGGDDSIDVRSVIGFRDPSNDKIYKIKVTFGEEMNYLYTNEKTQEPLLTIYFLKPDFQEDRIAPKASDIPSYSFPVPTSNFRYNKMDFDLRTISPNYYPLMPEKLPGIRQLDTKQGVEITLTIPEMDQMGVQPDFIIYATVEMKTTITETNGLKTVIKSWDAAGHSSSVPDVEAGTITGNGQKDDGIEPVFIIVPIIIVVLFILGLGVFLFFILRKKEEEPGPYIAPVPQTQTVDQMIFGDQPPPPPTAEQLYGSPQQQAATLPPAESPVEGLPPVQPQQTQTPQALPPTAAPQPAPVEINPEVTLPQ